MPDNVQPQTSPEDLAAIEAVRPARVIGAEHIAAAQRVDLPRLRQDRLARVRAELKARDYAGCVLFDPLNIRYATDARNMSVWTMHNAARYCFIATEGPVVLFDFHNCEHLSADIATVDEVRPTWAWYYFSAGPRMAEKAQKWAAEIADLVRGHGGGNRRLAADHCNPLGAAALREEGIEVFDAQEVLELARRIKLPDELLLMKAAVATCETAMDHMHELLVPGITENELWSVLHQVNIAMGGEWIETRLLSSGGRTNPWFQESSDRVIQAGDMVSYDTDLVGPYGYCADISRSLVCGGRPTGEQRRLYNIALDQVRTNMDLIKPGMTFRELAERSFKLPENCAPNRYSVVIHGIGLCDEYPHCAYTADMGRGGYDGILEAGMTVCVESYTGEVGGGEGVKLEEQVLITETGVEPVSTFPFEDSLISREV
jgi:Xaa-Pro aminopeptidase